MSSRRRGGLADPSPAVSDPGLARRGEDRIEWAAAQMPVLAMVAECFRGGRPLAGVHVAACLHVTAETANLLLALRAGGASVALCAANPLATQDEVAAALAVVHGIDVRARHGESLSEYERHIERLVADAGASGGPWLTVDDGADLVIAAHRAGERGRRGLLGGTEETATGLLRLRRLQQRGELRCPVLAINESWVERSLNDRHGTGQSALDGVVRATNVLLAGSTLVVLGYGSAGQGVAERARGAGAAVIVCEVDSLRALAARMAGYEVMPVREAAGRGDVFITVAGTRGVLRAEHFALMKDGAVLANAGHFDIEIDLEGLRGAALGEPRQVRPLVEQYTLADGRRLNLLVRGRVVNLAAAEGHPTAVMDISFALQALAIEALVGGGGPVADGGQAADDEGPGGRRAGLPPGVHPVPDALDREVARLKLAALGVAIDTATAEQDEYRRSWG